MVLGTDGHGVGATKRQQNSKCQMFLTNVQELQLNRTVFQVTLFKPEPLTGYWIWKLLPVDVEETVTPSQSLSKMTGSDSLPSCDGDTIRKSSACTQHAESEHDGLGTVVNEVTVVTTTTTTHKRYRVEDA